MSEEPLHWYVVLTVGGTPVEPLLLRSSLLRLTERHPFMSALRFNATGAQLEYWDEGDTLDVVADLAMKLWARHRSAGLPDWQVLGLEVVERSVRRSGHSGPPVLTNSQELHPLGL